MRILIIGGISRSLVNFRGPLITAMLAVGHEVIACAGEADDEVVEMLRDWGVRFYPLKLSRAGMSPVCDIKSCMQLRHIMKEECPDIVMAYTIKPVIWGGLAARLAGVPHSYSLVTGLGYAFMERGNFRQRLVSSIAKFLYRMSLRHSSKVFFQNPDDMGEFIGLGLVSDSQSIVVNGSGVDTDHYRPVSFPPETTFLLIGRLLLDKGLREFAAAARTIHSHERTPCKVLLVGERDPNPSSISENELNDWVSNGILDYWGALDDVRPAYTQCSVYVLPSYREGTPRTVLEAMAMGRPIITTDAPGCRETVCSKIDCGNQDRNNSEYEICGKLKIGSNGILIPPRDATALADAMRFFIDHPEQIAIMGQESRLYAEDRYDVHKVNKVLLYEMGL